MERPTESPIRIAVAEDNADLRAMLIRMLEHLGYQVACAVGDGAKLLEVCLKQHVDLVLTDLDMPKVDGLAAAEQIAQRGIPVILVSGHPDALSVVVEREPIVTCLLKPTTLESLEKAIRQALSQPT